MNTQSLSSTLSLSQSFTKSFGSINQSANNEEISKNNVAKSPVESSFQASQRSVSNGAKETGSNMLKPNISFSRTESLNLQIKTKEGDVVTIRFNRVEARHSGAVKMDQKGNGFSGEEEKKSIKSESSLNIESNSKKDKINAPLSQPVKNKALNVKPDTSKSLATESSNKLASSKKSELKIEQGGNKLHATKEEALSFESTKPLAGSNKSAVMPENASTSKLVTSKKSELQIEQGSNKLHATKEENLSFESTRPSKSTTGSSKLVVTPKNTGTSKLVTSKKSELQMEQGGNKLHATKEETLSFESTKPTTVLSKPVAEEPKNTATNKSAESSKLVASTKSELSVEQGGNKLNTTKQETLSIESTNTPKAKETLNKTEVAEPVKQKPLHTSTKIDANSRSELQVEQGGNKLKMTNEETYSFESTKRSNTSGNINKASTQNIESRPTVNVPQKSSTVSVKTDDTAIKVPTSDVSKEGLASTQTVESSASKSSLQMEQSIVKESNKGDFFSFNSDFNLSIDGDLNSEEQQSITNLLQAMGQVSFDFFQGNMGEAFSHAQNIGLETGQIAGFSMNLSSQKSVQAVTAYQQTKMPEQKINPNLINKANEFLAKAKESIAETKPALESFSAPKQSFNEMFEGVGRMFASDFQESREQMPAHDFQDNSGEMFLQIIKNIGNDLFSSNKMN